MQIGDRYRVVLPTKWQSNWALHGWKEMHNQIVEVTDIDEPPGNKETKQQIFTVMVTGAKTGQPLRCDIDWLHPLEENWAGWTKARSTIALDSSHSE